MKNTTKVLELRGQYKDVEARANKWVAFLCLLIVALTLLTNFTSIFDYAAKVTRTLNYIFIPMSIVSIAVFIIAKVFNYSGTWVKWMVISNIILVSVCTYFIYTNYISYLIFIPIFIATGYFDKKTLGYVSIITLTLYFIVCYLNIKLESVSEVIQYLHQNNAYNSWTYPLETLCYIVAPMSLTFIFVVIYCLSETRSGHTLIKASAESAWKASSIEYELNMASELQKSVLPDNNFVSPDEHFSLTALEIPAKEVCGDFYDYFMVDDHILIVLLADVSDKGAPAAMFMMSAKKAIQCAISCCHDLDAAIKLANTLICNDNKMGMFLTLWLAMIDTKTGVGKYTNAGHLPPVIKHADNSITILENTPDLFLGTFPDMPPEVHSLFMNKGDILIAFTDGITDASNNEKQTFGYNNVIKTISDSKNDIYSISNDIISNVNLFSSTYEQFDDMTLFVLGCNKLDTPTTKRITTKSNSTGTKLVIDTINELLEDFNCPDDKRRNIGVITDEICANISDYAYDGQDGELIIDTTIGDNYISINFIDSGIEFNPIEHNDPEFVDEPAIGGLGIFFIKNLADNISYSRIDNKNILNVTVIWQL